jgi:hypothetical protein
VDVNWWGIRTLQLLHLAKNIKLAKLAEAIPELSSEWVPEPVPDSSTNAAAD